jgi:hypothetical protein
MINGGPNARVLIVNASFVVLLTVIWMILKLRFKMAPIFLIVFQVSFAVTWFNLALRKMLPDALGFDAKQYQNVQGSITFIFICATLFQTYDFKIISFIAFPIYMVGIFFEIKATATIEQTIIKSENFQSSSFVAYIT